MKRICILGSVLALTLLSPWATAQNLDDIIHYSLQNPQSTARGVALSNALGSMGGDPSTLSTNPAGIGVYRSSVFAMTSSLGVMSNRDFYLGQSTHTLSTSAGFDGIGTILNFVLNPEMENGLLAVNFGISYNKLSDFNYTKITSGINRDNSFLDALEKEGNDNRLTPDNLLNDNAWSLYNWHLIAGYRGFLIEPDGPKDAEGKIIFDHFVVPLAKGEEMNQKQKVRSKGSLNEIALSSGFNVSNRLYGGITLGLQFLNRVWEKEYSEETLNMGKTAGLKSFSFNEKQVDRGAGVNFKLGLIARPVDFIRLGVAFHTPTIFSVNTKYTLNAYGHFFDDPKNTEGNAPEAIDKYSFYGPLRAMGSLAFVLGQIGFISADYQFSYFPLAHFSDGSAFERENRLISEHVKPTHEVRLGGELMLGIFALRAGGGMQTSPYGKELWEPYGMQYFVTGGAGLSLGSLYLDIAYRHLIQRGEMKLYTYDQTDLAFQRTTTSGVAFATIGFRF